MATTPARAMATACRLALYSAARSSAVVRVFLTVSHTAAILVWRWLPAASTAALYDARSASTLGRSRIRCARIHGHFVAQYLESDGDRSARHTQELGANA